jgi:hypothetical protein
VVSVWPGMRLESLERKAGQSGVGRDKNGDAKKNHTGCYWPWKASQKYNGSQNGLKSINSMLRSSAEGHENRKRVDGGFEVSKTKNNIDFCCFKNIRNILGPVIEHFIDRGCLRSI